MVPFAVATPRFPSPSVGVPVARGKYPSGAARTGGKKQEQRVLHPRATYSQKVLIITGVRVQQPEADNHSSASRLVVCRWRRIQRHTDSLQGRGPPQSLR